MLLLIDNYDSFTYNLYQYMGMIEPDILVKRNDQCTIEEIKQYNPDKIVLSPGPKTPEEAGICMEIVKEFYHKKPILGICLGHQAIVTAFGGVVSHAKKLCHGKTSMIEHEGTGIFKGIPSPMQVARYHSLAALESYLPKELIITARAEDGEIMAVRHEKYPVVGLQFHPESIYTPQGMDLMTNFIRTF